MYIRYESCVPNSHGRFPGVFALVNGLARNGTLALEDYSLWKKRNAELDMTYPQPGIYQELNDKSLTSWFREENAQELLTAIKFYIQILDKYGVPWRKVISNNPGEFVYSDQYQVVVRPFTYENHWKIKSL